METVPITILWFPGMVVFPIALGVMLVVWSIKFVVRLVTGG